MYNALIVEDERLIREGLRVVIDWERHGFRVTGAASNGAEALRLMETARAHLVLTDIVMPGMDGIEMIRRMRERGVDANVIMISGHRNFDYAKTAIAYGVREYLLKPVDADELVGAIVKIRRELDEKRGLSAEDSVVEEIIRIVEARYADNALSVKSVADALHYNPAYVGRLFATKSGTSFRAYLNAYRTRRAAELLADDGARVAYVCEQVGYRDINYFIRVFRAAYGRTPGDYARAGGEKN